MDRTGSDFKGGVESIREKLGAKACPIQIPIGAESEFLGMVDLVEMRGIVFKDEAKGSKFDVIDVPEELRAEAGKAREYLLECIAEADEACMEKYMAGETITVPEMKAAIRKGTIKMEFFPVLCGSAFKNKGVQQLLDAVVDYLPSPLDIPSVTGTDPTKKEVVHIERATDPSAPMCALAFKIITDPFVGVLTFFRVYSGTVTAGTGVLNSTRDKKERIGRVVRMHADKREEVKEVEAGDIGAAVGLKETITGDTLCDIDNPIVLESIHAPAPVISIAMEPKTKADEQKMGLSLMKLAKEDPSLKVSVDKESGQTLIAGMGELHLDIIKQRLFREFGVDTTVGKPQVAYRETILKKAEAECKYAKQTGGRGQFGHVLLRVEPLEPGSGVEFVDEVKGGVIPKEYIPAVEKGVVEALEGGILAGFPVIDMRVTLYYGSFHEVDSSEIAFKIAGSMCVKDACNKAKIQLLEPVMAVEVVCPDDFVSNIVGDLNRRRARILGMEPRAGAQTVKCEVPLAEMFGYSTDLRSNSQGRATFTMEYHHYAPVPTHVAESVVKK
jgi:elongation factor G